jgi:cytochrome o ubiquinol oxidase operon protein cyoD
MSEHHTNPTHGHAHDHLDQHGHDDNADHGSLKSYAIGFVLSVILTAIPFWLVMGNVFEKSGTTAMVVLGFAAVQIVVHMIYFLHMNTKSEGGWNMLALIFTIVIVVIALAGSIWVMYHLNNNMMPGMNHGPAHQIDQLHNTHQMHRMHEGP